MTAPERSCFTCRWANGDVCDRPHTSEDMEAAIDAYAVASGCHRNGGMPLDRAVVCPGHEASEGCAPEPVWTAKQERAAVVAWLRFAYLRGAADAIERGEHRREGES